MFPGLSRYLGRDRLSGDGSGACIVMRLATTRWPARDVYDYMSGVFGRRTFFAPQESQGNETREGGSAIAARYSFSAKPAEAVNESVAEIINRGKSG
jgi:hypothetical protein